MSNFDKPVLVIATAQNCGGCIRYKNSTRHTLLQQLKNSSIVDIIEYDHPSTTTIDSVPPNFHPQFGAWVEWFPCFLLFSGSSWNAKNQPLVGAIYGATNQNGNITPDQQPPQITSDNIINWINREISSGKFKNQISYDSLPASNVVYNSPNAYNAPNTYSTYNVPNQSYGGNRSLPSGYGSNRSNIKYGATINPQGSGLGSNYGRGW